MVVVVVLVSCGQCHSWRGWDYFGLLWGAGLFVCLVFVGVSRLYLRLSFRARMYNARKFNTELGDIKVVMMGGHCVFILVLGYRILRGRGSLISEGADFM